MVCHSMVMRTCAGHVNMTLSPSACVCMRTETKSQFNKGITRGLNCSGPFIIIIKYNNNHDHNFEGIFSVIDFSLSRKQKKKKKNVLHLACLLLSMLSIIACCNC